MEPLAGKAAPRHAEHVVVHHPEPFGSQLICLLHTCGESACAAEVARVYDDLKKLGYAPDAANTNIGSAIFANKPGDGSAREQAASCQRVLGGAANFAKEYATKRYRSNCINWGMLPFLVEDPSVFELGDCIYLPGVRKALLEAALVAAAFGL